MNLIRPNQINRASRLDLGAPASRRRVDDGLAGETPALPGTALRFWNTCRRLGTTAVLAALGALLANGRPAAAQTTNAPAVVDYSSFRLIADRNIFDPNRFPHTTRGHRQVSRSAPGFSLVGTMTYTNGLIAFFDGSDPDYRKVLSVNGTIAGYQVTVITLNGVKLSSTNKPVELAVGGQMRWESGEWQEAGAGELPAPAAETESPAADQPSTSPSTSEPNDVLKKLMQQREQEQK